MSCLERAAGPSPRSHIGRCGLNRRLAGPGGGSREWPLAVQAVLCSGLGLPMAVPRRVCDDVGGGGGDQNPTGHAWTVYDPAELLSKGG